MKSNVNLVGLCVFGSPADIEAMRNIEFVQNPSNQDQPWCHCNI